MHYNTVLLFLTFFGFSKIILEQRNKNWIIQFADIDKKNIQNMMKIKI